MHGARNALDRIKRLRHDMVRAATGAARAFVAEGPSAAPHLSRPFAALQRPVLS